MTLNDAYEVFRVLHDEKLNRFQRTVMVLTITPEDIRDGTAIDTLRWFNEEGFGDHQVTHETSDMYDFHKEDIWKAAEDVSVRERLDSPLQLLGGKHITQHGEFVSELTAIAIEEAWARIADALEAHA